MKPSRTVLLLAALVLAVSRASAQDAPVGVDQGALDREIAFYLEKTAVAPSDPAHFCYLADAYIKKARMTNAASWYDLARDAATTALKNDPENADAKVSLAEIAQARHDFPAARALLDDVLAQHPAHLNALGVSIVVHLAQGGVAAANHDADLLLAELPTSSGAMTYEALALESSGRDAEAEYFYTQALRWLEKEPAAAAEAWTRALFGRFLFRKGRYAEAREQYTKALHALPGYHLGLDLLGKLESAEGHQAQAIDYFTQAYEYYPTPLYLFDKALALRLDGDGEKAARLRDEAESILVAQVNADSTAHLRDLALVLLDKGGEENISLALKLAREESHRRRDHETLFALARAYFENKLYEEARRTIQEVLRSGIRIADYFHLAGLLEQRLDRPDRARLYFDLALQTNPEFAPAAQELKAARRSTWIRAARVGGVAATVIIAVILVMYLRWSRYRGMKKTRSMNQ